MFRQFRRNTRKCDLIKEKNKSYQIHINMPVKSDKVLNRENTISDEAIAVAEYRCDCHGNLCKPDRMIKILIIITNAI